MKRYIWPVLFSFLMLSCTSEVCELRINAKATDNVNDFTYYSCVLDQDGNIQEKGSQDGTFEFPDIHEGHIAITISAYSEESGTEFTGNAELIAGNGLNEIDVYLAPGSPGEKDMILHFPESRDSYATLTSEGTGLVILKDVLITNSRIDLTALSYGRYRVTVTRMENGRKTRSTYSFTCSEDTPDELIFLKVENDGKENDDVRLDLFDISSSPIEGKILVKDRKDMLCLEIEILRTTEDIDRKDLEFLWYRNGSYIGSGRSIEVEKSNEVVRFDCIMKSRNLGSYGSESLNISISM